MLTKTAYRVAWALYGEELNRTAQHKFRVRGRRPPPAQGPCPPRTCMARCSLVACCGRHPETLAVGVLVPDAQA